MAAEMERRSFLVGSVKTILTDLYFTRTKEAFLRESLSVLSQCAKLLTQAELNEVCDHLHDLLKDKFDKEEGKRGKG
jgi:hypothetical protein